MRKSDCQQEARVLREAREGQISAAAREHLADCEACSTAWQVAQLLLADAERLPGLDRLPDPTLVWWRSRQHERVRKAERATLPIQLAERLAVGLGVLGLIIGLSMTWPVVRPTLGKWVGGWAQGFSQALPLEGTSLILALFSSLFLLIGFGVYSQWAEN